MVLTPREMLGTPMIGLSIVVCEAHKALGLYLDMIKSVLEGEE